MELFFEEVDSSSCANSTFLNQRSVAREDEERKHECSLPRIATEGINQRESFAQEDSSRKAISLRSQMHVFLYYKTNSLVGYLLIGGIENGGSIAEETTEWVIIYESSRIRSNVLRS